MIIPLSRLSSCYSFPSPLLHPAVHFGMICPISSILCVVMGDARQLFNWGMLDFLGFWFFCDLCFDVILKSLGDILYLNRCFDSLAIYFSLKWKKISASPVSLNPSPLPPPSPNPQPIPLSSCIKIPQSFMMESLVDTLETVKIGSHQKLLWIVVVIILMRLGCSLSALGKFESFLWPLCLGSQC